MATLAVGSRYAARRVQATTHTGAPPRQLHLPVLRLPVLQLPVLRLPVLRLPVLRLPVLSRPLLVLLLLAASGAYLLSRLAGQSAEFPTWLCPWIGYCELT